MHHDDTVALITCCENSTSSYIQPYRSHMSTTGRCVCPTL